MNNLTRAQKIVEKMQKEWREYMDNCINKGAEYVFNSSYESVIKDELRFRYIECWDDAEGIANELDNPDSYIRNVFEWIEKTDKPLDKMYNIWIDSDVNMMETLENVITDHIEREMR